MCRPKCIDLGRQVAAFPENSPAMQRTPLSPAPACVDRSAQQERPNIQRNKILNRGVSAGACHRQAKPSEIMILIVVTVSAAMVLDELDFHTVLSGFVSGVSGTNTAWHGRLRRTGSASIPQAVSSTPSIAKATAPITRFRSVCQSRSCRAASPAALTLAAAWVNFISAACSG